jgi:hypothetical protein
MNPSRLLWTLLFATFTAVTAFAQPAASPPKSHQEFATHILQRMRLSETDKSARLIAATTEYLTALEIILAERQSTLDQLAVAAGPQGKPDEAKVTAAWNKAKAAFLPLRNAYVDQLESELHPYLVDRVKDGLTADAVPNLYAMYLEMVPKLTPSEKAHIYGLLVEGRENAITAIGHKAQTQWIHKYRGIINNFIAAQGHDFTTLSKAWDKANGKKD